jgi:DUF3102 family protein
MGKARQEHKRAGREAAKSATVALSPEMIAARTELAQSIRDIEGSVVKLSDAVVGHTIAIARILGAARPHFKHGEWGQWLASEFKWSARTSARYWSVYKLMTKVPYLNKLKLSVSVLYLLAELRSHMNYENPITAFAQIIALARTQRVTVEMAQEIIKPTVHTSKNGKARPVLTPRGAAFERTNATALSGNEDHEHREERSHYQVRIGRVQVGAGDAAG